MIAAPLSESDFWRVFDEAEPERRYSYVLNRPLTMLMLLFALSILVTAASLTATVDIGSAALAALWLLAVVLALAALTVVFAWRTFTRRSGVVVARQVLRWLDAGRVFEIPWENLDRDAFGRALDGVSQTAGTLRFESEGRDLGLVVYRPYMRLSDIPGLMAAILEHLPEPARAGPAQEERTEST
jgi:hypothetical protein